MRSSNRQSEIKLSHDIASQLQKHQAVTDVKLENLKNEVAKHNNFAQKIPVIEEKVHNLEDDVKQLIKTAG